MSKRQCPCGEPHTYIGTTEELMADLEESQHSYSEDYWRERIAKEIEAMTPAKPGWYSKGDEIFAVAKEQAAAIARGQA